MLPGDDQLLTLKAFCRIALPLILLYLSRMPTPAALFGMIVFGGVGFAAFVYGKKSGSAKPIIIGIALMAYPYFVESAWLIFLIGALLTAALFLFRD